MKKLKRYFVGVGSVLLLLGLMLMAYDYSEKFYLPLMSMGLVAMLFFFYEKR